ncbi:MAG: hypothetical protein GDYSWBUE_000080 [Candidatus Fervidibacterota bacterium]
MCVLCVSNGATCNLSEAPQGRSVLNERFTPHLKSPPSVTGDRRGMYGCQFGRTFCAIID